MPRNPRCVLPGVAYHVTQRGVNREAVFYYDQDRQTYLHLVEDQIKESGVSILGWCLMTNHVRWVVVPAREDSLAVLFRRVHGRYAQYLNARRRRTGHLWQNRYFSCPVAPEPEEVVLRYVEWNPVRAGIKQRPEEYVWSSAAAHLIGPEYERSPILDWTYWREQGGAEAWRRRLEMVEDMRDVHSLRRATYSGAPFGSESFVTSFEGTFGRQWRKPGRPRKGDGGADGGTEQSASVPAA
jgi:putative transposase